MKTNPMKPFDLNGSRALLRQELYSILEESLAFGNYTNPGGVEGILDYLISRQTEFVRKCLFEKEALPVPTLRQGGTQKALRLDGNNYQ